MLRINTDLNQETNSMRKLLQFRDRVSAVSLWMMISFFFSAYLVGPWSPIPKHFISSVPYLKPDGPTPEWLDYQSSVHDQRESVRRKLRTPISLDANNATIDQVLRSISDQIDVPIEYFLDDRLDLDDRSLCFNCKWEQIEAHIALRRTLAPVELSWEIHENIIFIVNEFDVELVFRPYELAWLMQNDAQSDEVLEFVYSTMMLEQGDVELFGSRLIAKASEQQHLDIEEFLATLQRLCPMNSRQLADDDSPSTSPAYCGGGFF